MTDLHAIAQALQDTFDLGSEKALRSKINWLRHQCYGLEYVVSITQSGSERSAANERLASARCAMMQAQRELEDLSN